MECWSSESSVWYLSGFNNSQQNFLFGFLAVAGKRSRGIRESRLKIYVELFSLCFALALENHIWNVGPVPNLINSINDPDLKTDEEQGKISRLELRSVVSKTLPSAIFSIEREGLENLWSVLDSLVNLSIFFHFKLY